MSSPKTTVCLLIVCLTCIVSTVGRSVSFTPSQGTTVNISSTDADCNICLEGRSPKCDRSFVFNTAATVVLKCPTSKFMVEFSRSIECDTKRCSGNINPSDSDSSARPLLDLNRKFTWYLKALAPKAFKIEFTKTGLRQINPSETCPDGHSYTLQAFQTTGKTTVGKYCTSGPITSAQILNTGSFSLEVPAGQEIQNGRFDVSVGEEIKSLAKITLTLPRGSSSSELLSPNYPDSFPDDDVMEWYFQVPLKHQTNITFLNLTQPSCRKKEAAVEYHSKGRSTTVLGLNEKQPSSDGGSFTMMLRNCEMDRGRTGAPGLSLGVKVSTASTSSTVLCKLDLSKEKGLSLHIEKLRPEASDCEMKENSVRKEKITVTSTSDLFFQDCLPEDVRVTASRVIECKQLKDCPKTPVRLSLPVLSSCPPFPLSNITWTLRPPQHGTVELTSPTGPLKQALPGQPCKDNIAIKVAEDDGRSIGQFCSQGAIQKIQIHTNMTVTMWSTGSKALRTSYKNVLDACFKEEITERYIFTVSSEEDTPVLLATPGWPDGMASYSTVSWIVSVPPEMEAHLMFANLSQPKCSNRHTNIRVQRMGSEEEDYSRREDEEAESEIVVSESFYLNMSNCMPEKGHFRVITKITLRQSTNLLLPIILSVVAALLVLSAIVLTVVCVVIKKKKKKLNHQVSIYNPNGTVFLPGKSYFPKTREDNESHVYTTIEDTLVYTHLLKKGAEIGTYGESDVYRPFTGHTDSQKPLVTKDSGADDMEIGVYHPFHYPSQQGPPLPVRPPSLPLVDNEIYQTEDQSEEEHSPNLGPRLEPEGGD